MSDEKYRVGLGNFKINLYIMNSSSETRPFSSGISSAWPERGIAYFPFC